MLKDSDAANATSIDDLKGLNIGVQIGTTSLDAVNDVIQPDNDPQVFDTSNDTFVLPQPADAATINVYVDGVLLNAVTPQGGVTWTFNETTNAITFNPIYVPEPGSEIIVRFEGNRWEVYF